MTGLSLKKKVTFSCILVAGALLLFEVILRSAGTYLTFHERDMGFYTSYWGNVYSSHIWAHTPGISYNFPNPEFDYPVSINNEGIRDVQHETEKPGGTFRIVILGDSYTEGQGCPFEQVWWNVMECSLQEKGYPVEIISGGVSGSDLCYSYTLLKERLLKFDPDLVLLALNDSDRADITYRGGMERFLPNGTTKFRQGPWFEPLYQKCHLARLMVHGLFGLDWVFQPRSRYAETQEWVLTRAYEALGAFQTLAEKASFTFCILLHPTADELIHGYQGIPKGFLSAVEEAGFCLMNALPATQAHPTLKDHLWPINQHLNGPGNVIFAEIAENLLLESGLLPPPGKTL